MRMNPGPASSSENGAAWFIRAPAARKRARRAQNDSAVV